MRCAVVAVGNDNSILLNIKDSPVAQCNFKFHKGMHVQSGLAL